MSLIRASARAGILGFTGFREEIAGQVCEPLRSALRGAPEDTRDIRVRVGRGASVNAGGAERPLDNHCYTPEDCARLLESICAHSLYARQEDVAQGFVTLRGGHRAGVCGRAVVADGQVMRQSDIGYFNIRVARQVRGAADALTKRLTRGGRPLSALIVSPPGMGKTTLLRDAVRQLSMGGAHVALIDERSEIAASASGAPQLDVGPMTDVLDGCPRAAAIPMLVRAMAPDIIAMDEIGRPEEAPAIRDAAASGCAVLATAHAASFDALRRRPTLAAVLEEGVIALVCVLGASPGNILEVREL